MVSDSQVTFPSQCSVSHFPCDWYFHRGKHVKGRSNWLSWIFEYGTFSSSETPECFLLFSVSLTIVSVVNSVNMRSCFLSEQGHRRMYLLMFETNKVSKLWYAEYMEVFASTAFCISHCFCTYAPKYNLNKGSFLKNGILLRFTQMKTSTRFHEMIVFIE